MKRLASIALVLGLGLGLGQTLALVLLSGLAWPLSGQAQSQTAAKTPGGSYIVNFPSDKNIADLILVPPPKGGRKSKERIYLKTSGPVAIPKSALIKIELQFDGPANIGAFDQLDADQVYRFSAAKLDFNDSQMAHLKRFKKITSINLDSTIITDKSLPILGSWPDLTICRLSNTDITGGAFDSLAKCQRLRSLSIEGITLKAGTLSKLTPLSTCLTSLNASHLGLTPQDVPAIAKLGKLTHLDVEGNKLFDNKCLKMLLPLTNLTGINLSDTSVTEQCLEDLYKFPQLKAVTVRSSIFWKDGKMRPLKNGIKCSDRADGSRMPMEMFSPLH